MFTRAYMYTRTYVRPVRTCKHRTRSWRALLIPYIAEFLADARHVSYFCGSGLTDNVMKYDTVSLEQLFSTNIFYVATADRYRSATRDPLQFSTSFFSLFLETRRTRIESSGAFKGEGMPRGGMPHGRSAGFHPATVLNLQKYN